MRRPLLLACVLLSSGSTSAIPRRRAPAANLPSLVWMWGRWCGPHGGGTFCETWLPPDHRPPERELVGEGVLDVDGARVFTEALRIESRASGVFYVATPAGEPVTAFRLVRSVPGEAVFENPQHDFPTRITYRMTDTDRLVAVVENATRRVEFALARAGMARPLDRAFQCRDVADGGALEGGPIVRFGINTGGDQLLAGNVEAGLQLAFESGARTCWAQVLSCEHVSAGEEATCNGDPVCVRVVGERLTVERRGRVVFSDAVPMRPFTLEGAIGCAP